MPHHLLMAVLCHSNTGRGPEGRQTTTGGAKGLAGHGKPLEIFKERAEAIVTKPRDSVNCKSNMGTLTLYLQYGCYNRSAKKNIQNFYILLGNLWHHQSRGLKGHPVQATLLQSSSESSSLSHSSAYCKLLPYCSAP